MASIIKRCDCDGWNECATTSRIFTLFEGASEIQRMLIGRAVTGLDVR